MNENSGKFQTVPTQITEAMHRAAVLTVGKCTGNHDFPPMVYAAMLKVAPQMPDPLPAWKAIIQKLKNEDSLDAHDCPERKAGWAAALKAVEEALEKVESENTLQAVGSIVFQPRRKAPQVEWLSNTPIIEGTTLFTLVPNT